MASYKVEICGVNTAKLPILKEEEKDALLPFSIELFDLYQKNKMFMPRAMT